MNLKFRDPSFYGLLQVSFNLPKVFTLNCDVEFIRNELFHPLNSKNSINLKECIWNNVPRGYAFLTPGNEGVAFLGFNIYGDYSDDFNSLNIVKQFLDEILATFVNSIKSIHAITENDNYLDQEALRRLGFEKIREVDCGGVSILLFEKRI